MGQLKTQLLGFAAGLRGILQARSASFKEQD
jgi:hypothetical protein